MALTTYAMGMNAKIYCGAAGTTPSTELANVRDVTLTLDAGEADVTSRANGGWKATVATLRECTVEFEMPYKRTDAGYALIKTAYLTGGQVGLKTLAEENGEGPDGDFSITSFPRSEPLEEGVMVSVTAKLTTFRSWVEAGGGA
jgi:hypothetical protein